MLALNRFANYSQFQATMNGTKGLMTDFSANKLGCANCLTGSKGRDNMLTENQIERWYEREQDQLDHQLMNGDLTQEEYDRSCKELNAEVNEMYHNLRNPDCRF